MADTNSNEMLVDPNNPHDMEAKAIVEKVCLETIWKMAENANMWAVETIKHIAIIGLAGLAGVFAIIANDRFPFDQLVSAATMMATSIFLCLVSFYLYHFTNLRLIKHYGVLLGRVKQNVLPAESSYKGSPGIKALAVIATAVAWTSAGFLICGGFTLFNALVYAKTHAAPAIKTTSAPEVKKVAPLPPAQLPPSAPAPANRPASPA